MPHLASVGVRKELCTGAIKYYSRVQRTHDSV